MKRRKTSGGLNGAPTLDPSRVEFSKHALSRLLEMAITPEEVRDCITRPRAAQWSLRHQSWKYERGRVVLPVTFDEHGTAHIKTVLWSKEGLWREDQAIGNMPKGRENRRGSLAFA